MGAPAAHDVIVDGYLPIADAFEERVEKLEAALLHEDARTREVLLEIYEMKRELANFRRAVLPLRDILTPIVRGDLTFFRPEYLPYFRDVYDQVSIVLDGLDAARDTHVAIVSNRQGEVSKQLTIVATVFLPLTFITGFFGQNFAFLVNHVTSTSSFWWLGVGGEVAALAGLLAYFRYKRWF